MNPLSRLRADERGIAFVEFALILPMFLLFVTGGAELANYMTVRMRVSQLALHVADHAARIGEGEPLAARQISEQQINDLLTGAKLQAAELNLDTRARVILSSLEPVANPNTRDRYRIVWQRCRGALVHTPVYGTEGPTERLHMGPVGAEVKALDGGATMFVEIRYDYRPLIGFQMAALADFTEHAAMAVRDRRDLTQIYNNEGATPSRCT